MTTEGTTRGGTLTVEDEYSTVTHDELSEIGIHHETLEGREGENDSSILHWTEDNAKAVYDYITETFCDSGDVSTWVREEAHDIIEGWADFYAHVRAVGHAD
jgi:hypothetical protein